jgi:hypothetical protein
MYASKDKKKTSQQIFLPDQVPRQIWDFTGMVRLTGVG